MSLTGRINFPKYLLFSATITLISLFLVKNNKELLAILIIYLATILNQLLLVEGVLGLFNASNKGKVVAIFLIKIILLFGALFLGVHLMGKRVIIPLLNYVAIIFVLGFSLKR